MSDKPKAQRGDIAVVLGHNDKPVAIAIYLGPHLSVVVNLDGTLVPKGAIKADTRRAVFWPGQSQHILAQVAAFAASAYQPPAAPPTYGETLEPCV